MTKRRRRRPSDGSIYKRQDGSWVASIRFQGRRKERRARSKAEAKEKLAELKRDVMLDVDPSQFTLQQLIERYLRHVRANRATSTANSYEAVLKHTKPLQGRVLTELPSIAIQETINGIKAAQTRHKAFKILKACLTQAVSWELIHPHMHPMKNLETPEYNPAEPNPFEPEEVQAIYKAAKGSRYLGAIRLAMMLGPRPAECWGLQWKDWDGKSQLRIVRQASESAGRQEIKPPKTKSGRRTLKLPKRLVQVLEDRRREAMSEGTAGSPWIWPGMQGAVTSRNNFAYREWKSILKRAGVEHRGFHQCRHTAATTMLNNGVAIKLVSRILGHSKVSMTLDIYNSLLVADQDQAVEFWDSREPEKDRRTG